MDVRPRSRKRTYLCCEVRLYKTELAKACLVSHGVQNEELLLELSQSQSVVRQYGCNMRAASVVDVVERSRKAVGRIQSTWERVSPSQPAVECWNCNYRKS